MKKQEMTLSEKLTAIQTTFKAAKTKFNGFGKYKYRSAEDILEALKPYLNEHQVTITIKETLIPGGEFPIIQSKAILSDGLQRIFATAIVGIDLHQKGMAMPQKFGSASSYGKKYALGNLLLIDDTLDSDGTNDHGKKKSKAIVSNPVSNKPLLDAAGLKKAITFVKSGGSIEQISSKYSISPEDLVKLQS